MVHIFPVSDLTNYNEVLDKVTPGSPVYLTVNGRGRYVIRDIEEDEELEKAKEQLRGSRENCHTEGRSGEGRSTEDHNREGSTEKKESGSSIKPKFVPSSPSWGTAMPRETNQFNFPGGYHKFFSHVFRTEFPQYSIADEPAIYYNGVIFTFRQHGNVALIVEILPEGSEANKIRRDCRQAGIPYLRFYHNHRGWWNTYTYVAERTRFALTHQTTL